MTSRRVLPTISALLLLAVAAGCSGPVHTSNTGPRGGAAAPAHPPTARPSPYLTGDGGQGDFGTETDPRQRPQSTFAMDVVTASYQYAGNLLRQGRRPDPRDVRPEEFVSAFREDYPQPAGNGFSINVDGTRLPDGQRVSPPGDVRLLRIGLQTRAQNPAERPDAALTFVIDVSGSMAEPGKLDLVKQALHTMLD